MLAEFLYNVFTNEQNGYCVNKYWFKDEHEIFVCRGYNLPSIKNVEYELECVPVKYKDTLQYDVTSFEINVKKDQKHIVVYLSCGLIKGIGKKTAEAIYGMFKEDCLDIIDKDPDQLLKIKGISSKKLEKIKKSYIENRLLSKITKELMPYGFTMKQITKIYARFKSNSADVVKNRPYEISEIKGIAFKTVDDYVLSKGAKRDSIERIYAAAKQVIREDMLDGNICSEINSFGIKLINLLQTSSVNKSNVCSYVIQMIKDGSLVYKKFIDGEEKHEYIYIPYVYETERRLADNIIRLLGSKTNQYKDIEQIIEQGSFKLDESQANAVRTSVTSPFSVITGGPGTGKTTILKKCVEICNRNNRKTVLMSPTGKAARRMEESAETSASTIHKYLHLGCSDDESEREGDVTINDATVFIDETSMLDLWIADKTFESLGENVSLVFIGDIDQLPSIGPGAILRDIIASGKVPVTTLKYIHRQGDDAPHICANAQNIKTGICHIESGNDFIYEAIESLSEAETKMTKQYIADVKEYGLENVKCLCPYKKNAAGVFAMNQILQEALNPINGRSVYNGINNASFRVGDPVIQLKNNDDVSNGDVGIVSFISTDNMLVTFFGDTEVEYDKDNIEEIQLAYAITIHKSQGSEFDSVLVPLSKEHYNMKKRRLLYTAVTRGKKKVSLYSNDEVLQETVNNNAAELRNTNLARYIQRG